MATENTHGEALRDAERLLEHADASVARNDGEGVVRNAWGAVGILRNARAKLSVPEQQKTRDLRSSLYLRAVQALRSAGRWEDLRKLAASIRFDRDARRPVRAELGKMMVEANQKLSLPAPPQQCDLVMKGGITSGVVYPLALVELAEQYTFRSIGGASVGAVAAASAAAAEFSRRTRDQTGTPEAANQGFGGLALVPDELGTPDPDTGRPKLLSVFRPEPETRPALDVVLAVLGGRTVIGKVLAALVAVVKSEPLPFLASLVLSALLVWGALSTDQAFLLTLSVLAAFATLATGAIASGAVLAARLNKAIARNGFGICRGYAGSSPGPEPLTAWLTGLIDRIAGLSDHPGALTFGQLWGTDPDRRIELVVTTTCLTFGRPYRLPFLEDVEKDGKVFFFNTQEFAELFPEVVCDQMRAAGEDRLRDPELLAKWGDNLRVWEAQHYLPFPRAEQLPVVVAVRMSLSFPVLVSMVPLYAVDESLEQAPQLERCWFSDGGSCSNLPIHFFDSMIPRRPTFAINLVGEGPSPAQKVDPSDQSKNVWMPSTNLQGMSERWNRFAGSLSVPSFLTALVNTMQSWNDGIQLTQPGYRDRIVHIRHTEREGGLNLNMDLAKIRTLAQRGEAAGERIKADFDWDNHVWIRLRSVLDVTDHELRRLAEGPLADPSARAFVERVLAEHTGDLPEANAPVTPAQAAELAALFPELEKLLKAKRQSYSDRAAPDPTPELRVRPRL